MRRDGDSFFWNVATDWSNAASLLASMRSLRHPAALAVPASARAKTATVILSIGASACGSKAATCRN
jgi:hypothetical protein